MSTHNEKISGDHRRIGNVEVGAVTDCLLHAISGIPESSDSSLA